jgi:DNA-binding transcriptional MerR regulator
LDKSPEAFRTISEAAQELNVPQHVLRFWETRFPQIKPMKRGGGRRYYRPGDVELLKGIRLLLYGRGYTIRGVQRILREQGVAHVAAVGRGEVPAAPVPADTPSNGSSEGEESVPARLRQGGSVGLLGERQLRELKLALEDLAVARRLLGAASE